MTAPPASPPRPPAPGPARPAAPTGRRRGVGSPTHVRSGPGATTVRAALRLAAVLAAVVTVYAVLAAVASRPSGDRYLDIGSPGPHGTLAVAEILRERGVTVSARQSVPADLTDTGPAAGGRRSAGSDGSRTVVVTDPDLLSPADLQALVSLADTGSDVVLVAPSEAAVAALEMPVMAVPAEAFADGQVQPRCGLPEATVAGTTTIGADVRFTRADDILRSGHEGWSGNGIELELCYGFPDAARLAVLTPTGPGLTEQTSGRLVLLGSGDFVTNGVLDESGNAALALGLLARHTQLDWVTPAVASEGAVGGQSLADLLPDGFWVGFLQALVALAVFALWRGRRLGPPVTEPLPVVVRSAETVEGRGRLYAAARAREGAAAALRAGLRVRLADRLGIQHGAPAGPARPPHEPEPTVLVAAVAEQTGRSPVEIRSLLYGSDIAPTGHPSGAPGGHQHIPGGGAAPSPHGTGQHTGPTGTVAGAATSAEAAPATDSDITLVRLAGELHELDRQVGRR
ncbi:protein of unknown function (DUF4350) [Parafrankia irregularis]|uniref:DUF4350 domain-containing protein n=1 Tax=Parafrankia irregularis TaxID=795642 RepID=A0A0S4QXV9_9ACTN|nr:MULTISPECIES: DUF4350 domain-containing protein [Parafrankia]MBE3202851.1 DUF4350 domain-containing protein [Parafrankia sp. CH37]CUU59983.1 protein of unknown function (DUF4350) [Parafrankia irregularis]